jgi:hypothetical protein
MNSFSHRPDPILASRVVRFVFWGGCSSTFDNEIFLPMASNKYELPTTLPLFSNTLLTHHKPLHVISPQLRARRDQRTPHALPGSSKEQPLLPCLAPRQIPFPLRHHGTRRRQHSERRHLRILPLQQRRTASTRRRETSREPSDDAFDGRAIPEQSPRLGLRQWVLGDGCRDHFSECQGRWSGSRGLPGHVE